MSTKIDELFYELQVRTEGVKDGIANAERSLSRFTAFVKANPLASTAALGAALGAVAVKTTAMAAAVERAGRRIESVFPGITGKARGLSAEFGVAQVEVVKLFDTIERNGEKGRQGLETTAQAALRLNQALGGTPDQLQGIAGVLDQVLDLFGLTGDQADTVAAKLYAISKGRVPLEELADAFRASATTIRDNNVSLDDAAAALTKLVESGLPARQAASALNGEIQKGRDAFRAFVGSAGDAGDAMGAFNRQVQTMGSDAVATSAQLREQLNNDLIDLGNKILPTVNKNLSNTLTLLDNLSGRSGAFDSLDRIANAARTARSGGISAGASAPDIRNLATQLRDGDLRLGELSGGQLRELERNLQALDKQIQDPKAEAARVHLLQQLHQFTRPAAAPAGGGGTTSSTSEQLAAGESMLADLRKALASLTDSLADDTAAALADFRTKVRDEAAKIPPEQKAQFDALVGQVVAQYQQQLSLIRSGIQDLAPQRSLRTQSADGVTPNTLIVTTDHVRAANEAIARDAEDTAAALEQQAAARQQVLDKATQEMQRVQATARAIEEAVRGATQLAEAFGLMDGTTASLVANLTQVAAGIQPLVTSIQQLQAGTGSTGAVVASALPVLGGVAALASTFFGDDPAKKAREEALQKAMEQTAAALDRLTKGIGDLGQLLITGNQLAAAERAIGAFTQYDALTVSQRGVYGGAARGQLNARLQAQGTSLQELQDLANGLNLGVNFLSDDLDEVRRAFTALGEALRQVELTKFAQTFTGQLDALQARFQLYNITDPVAQAQALVALQGRTVTDGSGQSNPLGSPAIAQALQGLDLNTTEGRAEAKRRLQGLFEQLNTADQLSPDQQAAFLGGLTGQQFEQALLDLKRLLDAADQQGGTGQTAGFAVQRTITEVTGDRIAGLLTSQDARLAELVEIGRAQLVTLGGGQLLASVAGAAAPAASGPVGGDIVIEQVTVSPPLDAGTDAVAWGRAAGQAMGAAIDQALGQRARVKARQYGDAVVTG